MPTGVLAGAEHKPCAIGDVKLLPIAPRGVANNGDGARCERTVNNDLWICVARYS